MNLTGLDHYNLRVPESWLEPLCRFYTEVLNLKIGSRPPFRSRGYWLYADGKPILHLTGFASDMGSKLEAGTTGWFSHIAFKCEDLTATRDRLKAHGVEYEMETVPTLRQTQLFFTDPVGVGVELNFSVA